MTKATKTVVTLASVPLAATAPIVWQFIAGTKPYSTVFTVHKPLWDRTLSKLMGKPSTLEITDSRQLKTTIFGVYILHIVPSDSPYRVSFVVADRRWLWGYKLIVRDFNTVRKTGNRTANFEQVPVETRQTFDTYDFLPYSLNPKQKRWSAKEALLHVLDIVEPKNVIVDGFPIEEKLAPEAGQFTLQNVMLRDPADIAIGKMLNHIPGADLWVDQNSRIRIYDATDLDEMEKYFRKLPPSTYSGDAAAWVDRREVRPRAIRVYYQREVECVFDFSDDFGPTSALPNRDAPFLENVLPTVDPETVVQEYDPESNEIKKKRVPPGTWITVHRWLQAMDETRPEGSLAWTFETIKKHWLKGDLEGVLGSRGLDLDEDARVAARVQVLRQHFRQTFRISRRYMERIRDLRAVRVALLDPVTGARAPAAVWGQACIIPTTKGKYMASRKPGRNYGVFRNVDFLAPSADGSTRLIDTAPGPAQVSIVDRELGIFRVEWINSPYGDVDSFVPCMLVDAKNRPTVVTRDLSMQDEQPMGAGMQVENGTNGIFLRETLQMRVMLTIVPAAPNNLRQFHGIEVEARNVATIFTREYRIAKGAGPVMEVFIPPGEATARFAWANDFDAQATLRDLLGLDTDDPAEAGLKGTDMPGFVLVNEERHLSSHAVSVGAEILAEYVDNVQGTVVTIKPKKGLQVIGNVATAALRVAAAPSAKVDAVHVFPGQTRRLSRFAMMSNSARAIVLGTIPYKE